jgi:hypothetical protein
MQDVSAYVLVKKGKSAVIRAAREGERRTKAVT